MGKQFLFISNNEKAAQAKGKKRGKRSRPNDKYEHTVLVMIHEDEPLDVVKLHPLERQQPDEKAPLDIPAIPEIRIKCGFPFNADAQSSFSNQTPSRMLGTLCTSVFWTSCPPQIQDR